MSDRDKIKEALIQLKSRCYCEEIHETDPDEDCPYCQIKEILLGD